MSKLFTVTLQCMFEGRDEMDVRENLSVLGIDPDGLETDISESVECLEGWDNQYPYVTDDEIPEKTCSELLEEQNENN